MSVWVFLERSSQTTTTSHAERTRLTTIKPECSERRTIKPNYHNKQPTKDWTKPQRHEETLRVQIIIYIQNKFRPKLHLLTLMLIQCGYFKKFYTIFSTQKQSVKLQKWRSHKIIRVYLCCSHKAIVWFQKTLFIVRKINILCAFLEFDSHGHCCCIEMSCINI